MKLEELKGDLIKVDKHYFCINCFRRTEIHTAEKKWANGTTSLKIDYLGCRKCKGNSSLSEEILNVVLMLDKSLEKTYIEDGSMVFVNWFRTKEPVDFDEIRILEADDDDIEKLAGNLLNDTDKGRRERIGIYKVYLNPKLELSPDKINLLKNKFNVITERKEY